MEELKQIVFVIELAANRFVNDTKLKRPPVVFLNAKLYEELKTMGCIYDDALVGRYKAIVTDSIEGWYLGFTASYEDLVE